MGGDGPSDLGRVIAACAALEVDLLGLQELDRGVRATGRVDQPAEIARALGMACAYAPARRHDGGTSGNALLVRGSLTDVEVLPMVGHVRLGRRDRRSALLARARVGDLSLSVAVAHLSIFVIDNVPQEAAVLDALAVRPGPRLLLGDLNRRTAWVAPGAARRGLRLVADDVPTGPRVRPRVRIDHVAVDGLVAAEPTVVDTGTSDHRALVVEISSPSTDPPVRH
jgi:endonuclease/exonuclease/phosphatase family metal-dependent hydrolase